MNKYISVNVSSLHGSIKHPFHFFYGVMFPLILLNINNDHCDNVTYILDQDIGPMFRLLFEIPLDIKIKMFTTHDATSSIDLLPSDIHPPENSLLINEDMEKVTQGKAYKITYDDCTKINNWIINKLCNFDMVIPKHDLPQILIIERKCNKSYETTDFDNEKINTKFKTSGAERRSIVNHNELVNKVKNYYNANVLNISFEYLPFFEQYYLFNNAKLIIAQHGAVLSHIIFMNKNATLIEIINRNKYNNENWFKPISTTAKIAHHQYITNSTHPEIHLDSFELFLAENNVKI